jgi:hypothetical protein
MNETTYSIVYHDQRHRVGYSPVKDFLFEYWLGTDNLVYVWCPEITDALLVYDQSECDDQLFILVGDL